jgi:ribosome-binding factor A
MTSQRPLRVSQSIKRELSDIIRRELEDERITGMVSITDVECSADIRSAKIFVSVFGDEETQKQTMEALKGHVGWMRGEICRRLGLRFAPEMQLFLDTSLERGAKVSELINKIARGEV